MKTLFVLVILLSTLALSRAEMQTAIPLWPDGAPGALGTNATDIPTLTQYLPDATNAMGLPRQSNATAGAMILSTVATYCYFKMRKWF